MAMQIHGNYDHSGTDYAERVKEKQADQRAEKVKEAEKAAEKKTLVSCPNHGMNTSAAKNRGRSLRDCIGWARMRGAIGKSFLMTRKPVMQMNRMIVLRKVKTAKRRR